MSFKEKLKADYAALFGKPWPVWIGGVAIGIINVFMFMFWDPWSTLDGVLNWGDNLGVGSNPSPLSPLLRAGSVVNLGLLLGAFASALLARQFAIRIGPIGELLKGLIGGLLIGTGAVLVRGCNIGGFYTGTSALGAHGLMMGLGLVIGAFIGARYLVWEMMRDGGGTTVLSKSLQMPELPLPGFLKNRDSQPIMGGVFLAGLLALAVYAYRDYGLSQATADPNRFLYLVVILVFGLLLGIISQRTRLCFVHAFREPFITGDASHTKAMLLALVISVTGITIAKYIDPEQVAEFVRPTFWVGSLSGGIIFGFGMTMAGGCGGGMIWRVGEGHVKLWMALIGYILSAGLVNRWLVDSGNIDKLGDATFLPDSMNWGGSLIFVGVVILLWYLLVQWNELSHRFAAVK